jgi:uncharacterized protein YfaS (alpha-2-macroglobulin family)
MAPQSRLLEDLHQPTNMSSNSVLCGALLLARFVFPTHALAQGGVLRVVRSLPSAASASPGAVISVTFDRPVAGSLDRTVDPASILRVEPVIAGKLEWRDPVTIRLVPAALLTPGTEYVVTIANGFRAMDGSSLAEPYRFSFRVLGPTLLAGAPVGANGAANERHITPNQRFSVVYSAPVDLAKLSSVAFLQFGPTCGAPAVRLTAVSQRALVKEDPWQLREGGARDAEGSSAALRRLVQLVPQTALPRGCAGELILPRDAQEQTEAGLARWGFATYGDFRIDTISCGSPGTTSCPTGPLTVTFTNPVRGAEVARRVRLYPDAKFTVRDTAAESERWTLEAKLAPRVGYAVVVDTGIRDIYGQTLKGNPAAGVRTTGYLPSINHAFGRLLVERTGFRTLAVQHVNVDTLISTIAPIPDSLEARLLSRFSWGDEELWTSLLPRASVQRIPVRASLDRPAITGVRLPALNAMRAGTPTLMAVRISGRTAGRADETNGPAALAQVTDLGVHARIGLTDGAVWVTGVNDGKPRSNAVVVLHDTKGKALATARTDAQGLARFVGFGGASDSPDREESDDDEGGGRGSFEGYVSATLADDRALTAINRWDPDLSPWNFNVSAAYGDQRLPLAGAVFTERGIYRPGERLYAKAIVRNGSLGALRVPAAGDSLMWIFHDRDEGELRRVTAPLSAFGTAQQTLEVPKGAAIGQYELEIKAKRMGKWRSVASTSYRVAEYRPPEFLVDLAADKDARLPGEKLSTRVQARYLFGAPMGRATVSFTARQSSMYWWELEVPGMDGWLIGDNGSWWEESAAREADVFSSRDDTLDARGERAFSVSLPAAAKGRASRVTVEATVTDVNRQSVSARSTTVVYPAEIYVAAKPASSDYFWKVGTPQTVNLLAVRPNGQKVSGTRIAGTVVRREWHEVRRDRDGVSQLVGEWVADTVAHCTVTSAATPVPCTFTPGAGGIFALTFTATDRGGRVAVTSFQRWATGEGWVPWNDESQFKMDVIPDRLRYSVGDTATIMFASPFTNAEAWITVEREGLIQQRQVHITSGSTTLKFPITEAFAPNAFVSILVTRGRSAPPGTIDDAGRPTIRVGYAELRVTPEVKRLTVNLAALPAEYRPGDTARVRIQVRDKQGGGPRSEVTLWAVDEGVLSLTGYKTPDPLDLIYQERGLGMRLASNMTSVAPQIPEGEKGRREAGGGGGAATSDILRSKFQTTAFFLGSVVTDAQGNVTVSAKLPDNLTTFRLMAVAVTAGDRYGKGESSLLVTRPLLARQALPRFVRPGDEFTAGAVINRRDGAAATVKVSATATGVTLRGDSVQTVTLAALRGSEVRFPFLARRGDSATFRFDVTGERDADAVRVSIPFKPDYHPVAYTVAGTLRDRSTVDMVLPAGIDPDRSRLSLTVGTSPLAAIRGMAMELHVYPYYCSEQVISAATPIIALHRAHRATGNATAEIALAVEMLSRRQRVDGGIGYWGSSDWTTPWLSAYAGLVLLDARDEGVKVDTLVLSRLAAYLTAAVKGNPSTLAFAPVNNWRSTQVSYGEQVAAADFMSRFGRPNIAVENELLRNAAQLGVEDRARLAEVFARRRELVPARALMAPLWARVQIEGRRAVLPDSVGRQFYFTSRIRPIARMLSATLAVDPQNALIGPLAEALVQREMRGPEWYWNTQDYGSAISALAMLDRVRRTQGDRTMRVAAGEQILLQGTTGAAASRDSVVPLTGLLTNGSEGSKVLRLSIDGGAGEAPIYYYLTVAEVPLAPPVTVLDHGIQVERWYERPNSGTPVTSVVEGELVRVRLKVTVPSERYFVVLDDALPAGLEAIDVSLRTASTVPGPGVRHGDDEEELSLQDGWYGSWDSGWWSPFDHREIRDERVVYAATTLFRGSYTASYLARATTPGTFVKPPAHAEEMYNPSVNGRSDGGNFVVTARQR